MGERFDPVAQHWTALAPMRAGRWYRVDGIGCAVGSAGSSVWLALVVAALVLRRRGARPA